MPILYFLRNEMQNSSKKRSYFVINKMLLFLINYALNFSRSKSCCIAATITPVDPPA